METVDGRDVDAVFEAASRAVERGRQGGGPSFVQCVTDRYSGSIPLWPELPMGDTDINMAWDDSNYGGEHEDWYRIHDPIFIYVRKLIDDGVMSQAEIVDLDADVSARNEAAKNFALNSPLPPAETALNHVFAPNSTLGAAS